MFSLWNRRDTCFRSQDIGTSSFRPPCCACDRKLLSLSVAVGIFEFSDLEILCLAFGTVVIRVCVPKLYVLRVSDRHFVSVAGLYHVTIYDDPEVFSESSASNRILTGLSIRKL